MKKVKIKTGEIFPLTSENFERYTGKKAPYYQKVSSQGQFLTDKQAIHEKYVIRYFALCPVCGLPVQCVNLFQTGTLKSYAKHRNNVPGLGCYSENEFKTRYDQCYLANPQRYDRNQKRKLSSPEVQKLLELLVDKFDRVIAVLSHSLGFIISSTLAQEFLKDCLATKQFAYRYATEANLPWTFVLCGANYNLWGRKPRKIGNSAIDILSELQKIIPFIGIRNGQLWWDPKRHGRQFTFSFTGHVSKPTEDDREEFIEMQIWEKVLLGTIRIPVESDLFLHYLRMKNWIVREPELLTMARELKNKHVSSPH